MLSIETFFDQVVWIIFEDWIYVTNVAKYVMQWL
jgi:hypothetical protein